MKKVRLNHILNLIILLLNLLNHKLICCLLRIYRLKFLLIRIQEYQFQQLRGLWKLRLLIRKLIFLRPFLYPQNLKFLWQFSLFFFHYFWKQLILQIIRWDLYFIQWKIIRGKLLNFFQLHRFHQVLLIIRIIRKFRRFLIRILIFLLLQLFFIIISFFYHLLLQFQLFFLLL